MDNRTFVKGLLTAYAKGDLETVFSGLSDDICYEQIGTPGMTPYAGRCTGKAAMQDRIASILEAWEIKSYVPGTPIVDGNRAAVVSDIHYVARATGEDIHTRLGHFFTLTDGQVTELLEFYDTGLVSAKMG